MNIKKDKLKILIPLTIFSKQGGFRVISELANNWSECGHDVSIACYCESSLPYYPTIAKIIWVNIYGNEISSNHKIKSKFYGIKALISMYKFLNKNSMKYDIILANSNLTTFPVYFASKSKNFYYIQAYEPDFVHSSLKNYVLKLIAWLSYFVPLKRVVNSQLYINYKNIRSKDIVPPGLNLDVFYPKKISPNNKNILIVGCIGRKEEWKGHNDVGDAVKILHEKGYKDCIKLKVAFNSVNYENHELIQPHGDENLANYYRSLDVLVAPGHLQIGAVHYPVIEAMACNVPVITTGYYPANNENSFIVPIKSPIKIAEILELILKDYSITINKVILANQKVQEFAWKAVSNRFIEIFKK